MTEERLSDKSSATEHVLSRLERSSIHIVNRGRVNQILQLEKEYQTPALLEPTLITAYQESREKKGSEKKQEEVRQRFENIAVVYLLKKMGEATAGFQIRELQVDAIATLLNEDHLQAATSFGKSSVVIPISSLVYALSHNENVAVTTVSPELRDALLKNVEDVWRLLPETLKVTLKNYEKSFETPHPTPLQEAFHSKEPQATHGELIARAESFLEGATSVADNIPERPPSVTVFSENDFVFHTMTLDRNPYGYILFDEMHVPFTRSTVYYTTEPADYFKTSESAEEFIVKRFLAEYMKEAIVQENLFEQKEGGDYDFRDEQSENRLYQLINNLFKSRYETARESTWYTNPAIASMSKASNIPKTDIAKTISEYLEHADFQQEEFKDVVSEVLLGLMKTRKLKEGVDYQIQDGKVLVRDHFMGLGLPTHEFSPAVALGVQTWNSLFSPIDYRQGTGATISFEGWVANMLSKPMDPRVESTRKRCEISAVSGSLFSPTLLDVESPEKTTFAKFMEKQTGHEAVFVGEPKTIPPPRPQVVEAVDQLNQTLLKVIEADSRLTILACYDEGEVPMLQKLLTTAGRDVIIANASLDETTTALRCDEFANAKPGTVLITTGRVGLGVDFKNAQGFTDHKTIIYGVPFAVNQVYQLMGRRRLESEDPENDFVWLLSKEQVRNHPAYVSQKETHQKHLEKEVERNPLRGVQSLLNLSEGLWYESSDRRVDFDLTYQYTIDRFKDQARDFLREAGEDKRRQVDILLEEAGIGPQQRQMLEGFCQGVLDKDLADFFVDVSPIPDGLYWELKEATSFIRAESNKSLMAELMGDIRRNVVNRESVSAWLDGQKKSFVYLALSLVEKMKALGFKEAEETSFALAGFIPITETALKPAHYEKPTRVGFGIRALPIVDDEDDFLLFSFQPSHPDGVMIDIRTGEFIRLHKEKEREQRAYFLHNSPKNGAIVVAVE